MPQRIFHLALVTTLLTAVAFAQNNAAPIRPTVRTPVPTLAPPKPTLYEKLNPTTLTPQQRTALDQIRKQTDQKVAKLLADENSQINKLLTPAQMKDIRDLDSMSEMGETESLRLQMALDRRSKFMETLSNLLKKESDTSSAIIQNIK
jgi:hypothetical protein